jgi:hypothetical protein
MLHGVTDIMDKKVHILHRNDKGFGTTPFLMLCGYTNFLFAYHPAGGRQPTCAACILLAMTEPENVHSIYRTGNFVVVG